MRTYVNPHLRKAIHHHDVLDLRDIKIELADAVGARRPTPTIPELYHRWIERWDAWLNRLSGN